MPLYDFECPCGRVFEAIANVDEDTRPCECGKQAKRIISASGHFCGNEDADWIRSVRLVVDKRGGAHCQEFLQNPTRSNYKAWMKGEGLRPLEDNEPMRPPKFDHAGHMEKVLRAYKRRTALEVR